MAVAVQLMAVVVLPALVVALVVAAVAQAAADLVVVDTPAAAGTGKLN